MIATRVVLKSLHDERAELEHDLTTAQIHRNYSSQTELEAELIGVNTRIERLEALMQRDLAQRAAMNARVQARVAQVISPNKGSLRFFVGLGLCAVTAMGGDVHLAWIGGALIGWACLATNGVTL